MAELRPPTTRDPYTIRRYETDDREGLRSLYGMVYREETADWFEWRYESTPYCSHVPVFVAEADGAVVGAVAFLPFPIRSGATTTLALQPADAMVHPDHRRQGLFTRILRTGIEYYDEREPSLFFNFPTDGAKPGLARLGWSTVELATYYRIQNPGAFLSPGPGRAAVEGVVRPLVRRYHGVRDRLARKSPGITVERRSTIPTETLVTLYERDVPARLHVPRDERYYGWRFADPNWTPTTYVATRDSTPLASAITCPLTREGVTVLKVMDVLPAGRRDGRDSGLDVVLAAIVVDHPEVDLIAVPKSSLPGPVAAAHGFHADDASPLSWLSTPTSMVVRPLDAGNEAAWSVGGRCLTDTSNWRLSFSDEDTPLYS